MDYDSKTKRFKVEKKEEATQTEGIRINTATANTLVACAKEDGWDLEGTKQSKSIKRNRALRAYAEVAIQEFVTARK